MAQWLVVLSGGSAWPIRTLCGCIAASGRTSRDSAPWPCCWWRSTTPGSGPFTGGFVGVDVFFVISGFLITSLLVREAERSGRVSLLGFYARRARRILPGGHAGPARHGRRRRSLLLSAVEASSAIEDAVWATFFAANIKLTIDGTDYFNAEATPSPLQHYWSLAVEEQFYLVWPLLVLLLCLLVAGRGGVRAEPRAIRDVAVPVLPRSSWCRSPGRSCRPGRTP